MPKEERRLLAEHAPNEGPAPKTRAGPAFLAEHLLRSGGLLHRHAVEAEVGDRLRRVRAVDLYQERLDRRADR
jgi:hypothetical protein